jgi:asparagine synthase (glutamine-hydrolysing)
MCGLAGFFCSNHFSELSRDLVIACNRLRHRGPDDAGLYVDKQGCIGLGHRRLSIIDLSEMGRQPMAGGDGRVQIVYNGEVYNFKELRDELKNRGHRFRGASDTEVILQSYLQWGVDCFDKLAGMFALAIWDSRRQQLVLARDRMGIKPLYYYHKNNTLLFASELKALMAFKAFPRLIDDGALCSYLHYQYIPAPQTIFQDTYKLLPGSYMLYQGAEPLIAPYWHPPAYDPAAGAALDEPAQVDALDRLLTRTVAEQLVSDVPIGALLSGGIDSSLVAALMQKSTTDPVRTFTIGFRERQFNEAPWAARVAAHLGTDHTELVVEPGQALAVIAQLPEIYDEPFADSSAIPTYLVSKLTRSHVSVALSGDGGDEQFAGYVRYWMTRTMADWMARLPAGTRKTLAAAMGRLPAKAVQALYLPWRDLLPHRFQVANFSDKWQKLILLVGQDQLSELYRMTVCLWTKKEIAALTGQNWIPGRFETLFETTSSWPALSRLMQVDQGTYLPDAMLTKVDRASMAVSLEVRVPLLDHRVVEFSARLPEHLKYRHGTGKYLLKKVLARYVPRELFERPKMGFGVPLDQWLRADLKELMLDYLSPARLKREGRFDADIVARTVKEQLNGSGSHHHRLWALLMWQMWHERWMDG